MQVPFKISLYDRSRKCAQGLWYDANFDQDLQAKRMVAEEACFKYNNLRPSDIEGQQKLLKELIADFGEEITILNGFICDYGYNLSIGDHTFINNRMYIMDSAKVTIGKWCFFGPNCALYCSIHPIIATERNTGLEKAKPITIGDNVWFGGNVTVLPGVTIGSNTVIGAGSVVTHDIPSGVVDVGNPCKVLREITEKDSIKFH